MWTLAIFLGLCFVAASTGGIFRPGDWYARLNKPSWNPPDWLFAPAWAVLFLMIAVSGWRAWEATGPGEALVPMAVYGLQLALNALWSPLFFGLKRMDWAFYELVVFWLAIAANIAVFAMVDTVAALLLVPYLAWVTFAGYLNLTLWRMNPEAVGQTA